MRQNCVICSKNVANLSTHVKGVHKTAVKRIPKDWRDKQTQQIPYTSTKVHEPLFSPDASVLSDNDEYSGADVPVLSDNDEYLASHDVRKYLSLIQQFSCMTLHAKRAYIRKRAPANFINLLRECIKNVVNGNIHCDDKGLLQRLQSKYSCTRVIDRVVSDTTARAHLSQSCMLQLVLKVIPLALTHLEV